MLLAGSGAALALRLVFRIGYAEEIDSLRFLAALQRFDLVASQPHFPGYPVFVLLGKLVHAFTGDTVSALAILCATCGGLLPIPVALFTRRALGESAARWSVLLVAVNPALWLFSEKLLSDMPGLLFLFSAIALLARGLDLRPAAEARPASPSVGFLCAALFVFGLGLGGRLSYFPFLASALLLVLWHRGPLLRPLVSALAGVLVWLVPLLALTGWQALLEVSQAQVLGHFTRFGGSIVTEGRLGYRLSMMLWELSSFGLGTIWSDRSWAYLLPTAGLAALLCLGLRFVGECKRRALLYWSTWILPYLIWAFLAQNVTLKPRHMLPLIVIVLVLAAGLIDRALRERRTVRGLVLAATAFWVGGQAVSGLLLVSEHQRIPSNAVMLAREAGAICERTPSSVRHFSSFAPAKANLVRRLQTKNHSSIRESGAFPNAASQPGVVVYTATLEGHIRRESSCPEIVVVQRASQVRVDMAHRDERTLALLTSEIDHLDRLPRVAIRRFQRNRYIQNAQSELVLYRLGGRREE